MRHFGAIVGGPTKTMGASARMCCLKGENLTQTSLAGLNEGGVGLLGDTPFLIILPVIVKISVRG